MINSSILNVIYDALKNLKKNSLMSLASVGVLSACLVIMGSSVLVAENLNQFVTKMEKQNEIAVFLDDKLSEEQNAEIGEKIKAINNVESSFYISKDEALEEYKKENSDQAELIAGLEANNPIRNSYHIKIRDLKQYDSTVQELSKISGIAKVVGKREIVNMMVRIRKNLSMLALWVFIILAAVSLFIISNTIRLGMFTRKLEINIMKFVGATDNFIRLPFIIEGILLAVISTIFAFLVQWFIYSRLISPLLVDLSLFRPTPFLSVSLLVFYYFLGFSTIIGVLGSIIPMRKYLKV